MRSALCRPRLASLFTLLSLSLFALVSGCGGASGPALLPKSLTAVAVTPGDPSIAVGATQQLKATANYSDGTTADVTSTAAWTSSAATVASVNSRGMVTADAAGSATISASLGGVTGTDPLSVTAAAPTLSSIAITPASPGLTAGAAQQFTATATYSDSSTNNVTTTATWTSSATAVATISASGLATAVAQGSTTITATLNGVSGTTSLTVAAPPPPALASIAVTPANPSFAAASTQQFTATATYADSSTKDVTASVTWSSSNSAAATITPSGLADGVAAGTTTIAATSGSVSGNTTATITTGAPGVNISTWHVDNNRSGLNDGETTLTPSDVNSTSFGKLFSLPIDGYAYAEPLLISGVTIGGAKHNVLYVATENDSVYAFDADTAGSPLWQISLLQPGETPLTNAPIKPFEGVTSTPVIDPATNTLYVVSAQIASGSAGNFRLHALNITTGAEKFGGPVTLNVSVAATNSASVGGIQTLDTSCIQRAALLLANGNVYIGFGGCHSGWLVAYNASNLSQVGVFNSSTALNGEGKYASAGGVWMGSGGPVADSSGNVYATTGNGPWNGTTAFADSVLKFPKTPVSGPNGTMQPSDYFTPSIYQYMDCNDSDLAAGGLILIPGSTTLIAGGKTGTMYLVNSSSLGHESSNDAGAIQQQVWGEGLTAGGTYQGSCTDLTGTNTANITSYEIFGTSAYFNSHVYLGVTPTSSTAPGGVRQFEYSGTLLPFADTTPAIQQGTRGTSPFISADGTNNGIVWMIDEGFPLQNTQQDPSTPGTPQTPTHAILRAFSAASYPNELWSSDQSSADNPGYGIKFTSPVVANGKVYMSTGHDLTSVTNPHGEIDVYGIK